MDGLGEYVGVSILGRTVRAGLINCDLRITAMLANCRNVSVQYAIGRGDGFGVAVLLVFGKGQNCVAIQADLSSTGIGV